MFKGIISDVVADLKPKHLAVGMIVLFATAWTFRRVLPGAARRMGLTPAPLAPSYQNSWPEPFGLVPLLPVPGAMVQPSMSATSTATSAGQSQADLGRAIVAATQAALPSSSGDILANITAGNA